MKVKFVATTGDMHYEHDSGVGWTTRPNLIAMGFTAAELDAAEASPGDWIKCPREDKLPPGVRTKSEVIEALREDNARLTQEQDAAVAERDGTLSDEQLLEETIESLQDNNKRLIAERDALLNASKRLIHWFHGEHNPLESALPLWDASRAAIANVEPSWRWQNEPRRLPQTPPFPIKLPFDKLAAECDALLKLVSDSILHDEPCTSAEMAIALAEPKE